MLESYPTVCRLILLVFFMGACLGCRADSSAIEASPAASREKALELLSLMIVQYQKEKGPLPQSNASPSGFHQSWRMMLIPYADFDCGSYRQDEAWNTRHNQIISANHTFIYVSPFEEKNSDSLFTSYVMLLRSNHDGGGEATKGKEVLLPDEAILIVESVECGIGIAEPKDLPIESLFEGDSPYGPGKLNSFDDKYIKAIRVDGKVVDIPKDLSVEELRKLLEGKK